MWAGGRGKHGGVRAGLATATWWPCKAGGDSARAPTAQPPPGAAPPPGWTAPQVLRQARQTCWHRWPGAARLRAVVGSHRERREMVTPKKVSPPTRSVRDSRERTLELRASRRSEQEVRARRRGVRSDRLPACQRQNRAHRATYGRSNTARVRLAVTRRRAASEAHAHTRLGPRHSRRRRGRRKRSACRDPVTHTARRPRCSRSAGRLRAGRGSCGGGNSAGRGVPPPPAAAIYAPAVLSLTPPSPDTGCGGCAAAGRGSSAGSERGAGGSCGDAGSGCYRGQAAGVLVSIPHLHLHGAGGVVGDHPGAVPVRGGRLMLSVGVLRGPHCAQVLLRCSPVC